MGNEAQQIANLPIDQFLPAFEQYTATLAAGVLQDSRRQVAEQHRTYGLPTPPTPSEIEEQYNRNDIAGSDGDASADPPIDHGQERRLAAAAPQLADSARLLQRALDELHAFQATTEQRIQELASPILGADFDTAVAGQTIRNSEPAPSAHDMQVASGGIEDLRAELAAAEMAYAATVAMVARSHPILAGLATERRPDTDFAW
jgi:hypothetical protein